MLSAVALLIQAAAFWLAVCLIPINAVGTAAWLMLYGCCAAILAVSSSVARLNLEWLAWLRVLFYALLLSVIFLGADFALDILRGSVKPRGQLPVFFDGLELYFVLMPGVASVAIGGAARGMLRRWHGRMARPGQEL